MRIRIVVALSLAVAGLSPAAARADGSPICDLRDPVVVAARPLAGFTEDPGAGRWGTWTVHLGDVRVGPPPSTASPQHLLELAELHRFAATRDAAAMERIRRWDGPAAGPWTDYFLRLVAKYSSDPARNPPRFARQMAIFETAIFDALVVTWNAKYCYQRPPPSAIDPALLPVVRVPPAPSYPSEHAAVAGAAAVLLGSFFPEEPGLEELAWQAAESRLWAGAAYRSDVSAGWALGRAVAAAVLADRQNDGSQATWDGSGRITGTCNWEPTPPAFRYPPLEPVWGRVRPWLMSSGSQFRPPPPPACDGPEYLAAARDLYETSLRLTDRQKEIATYWAGGPGTETPPGMNLRIALQTTARHGLTTMQQSRVLAYVAAALADAGIAAWDAKFTYWWDRPVQTIRRLWDPSWLSYITTPPFPGYISGHATFSGAASETLAWFFPDEAVALRAQATEAAQSRFYGGIHARYDNETGLMVGREIAELAVARARRDGP